MRNRFFVILINLTAVSAILAYHEATSANVVGTDTQNFNPVTSGLDFVTVHSSETLKPGVVNLGGFLNYAVNTLPYFDESPQGKLRLNDSVLGMDLNAGLGLTDNWEIGISLPQILRQSVSDRTGARGEFEKTGATEVRINSKYRLWGDDRGGFALIGSMNVNRIENNPYTGANPGPTFNFEVAADTTIDRVAVGVNLGYRFRQPGTRIANSFVEPLKNQMIASLAASYFLPRYSTKLIAEVFGSLPAEKTSTDGTRSLSSLEAIGGAKHDLTTNLSVHAGAGIGLIQGIASPDWRIYTGVNYAFGPLWEKSPPSSGTTVAGGGVTQFLRQVRDEQPGERFRTQSIHFEFDSDKMIGNYGAVLAELAEHLSKGYRELIIEGHTDSVGPEAYNQRLSLKRAESIKRYLINRFGQDAQKILAVGYGESRPIADNGNYQGRQLNRRVEFVIRR